MHTYKHAYVRTYIHTCIHTYITGADGAVAMSSANGLVGTVFASRYWLQPQRVFKGPMGRCMATTPSSLSLPSNRVTTNTLS